MAKDTIRDFSATASANTDIQSVNVDENCAASGINNAIRELMADLKDVSAGTVALETPQADSLGTDTITEKTSAAGVTIDGVLLKDGAIGSIASAVAAHLTSINGGQIGGSRNLIINGNMAIAQRGTSSTASGGHSVDRYRVDFYNFDQLGVTQSQSTTVPTGEGFSNSLKVAVTTQETTLDANELFIIRQTIEAQNLQRLAYGTSSAKSLTLSFWVRSSLAGKYSVLFYSEDGTRSNTPSFTISSADTWEFVTIAIDGDTAGTINNDNGKGLQVTWVLAAGTDWAGTPHTGWGAFVETDDYAFSDQVNFAAQTGEFYITGVQLEVGTNSSDFEHESFVETLRKCQRYYQRAGNVTGFFTNTTGRVRGVLVGETGMRAQPTASNTTGLTIFYKNTSTGGGAISILSGPTNFRNGPASFIDFDTTATSTVQGQGFAGDNNTDNRYFELDAEL